MIVNKHTTGCGMRLCELVYDHLSFRSVFGPLIFRSSQPSNLDIKVLLKYLQRELKVIIYDDEVITHFQRVIPSTL